MYVRITTGHYKNKEACEKAWQSITSEWLTKFRGTKGVKDLYALRPSDLTSVVVAVYESKEHAKKAEGMRNDAVSALLHYQAEYPRIIEGESLL